MKHVIFFLLILCFGCGQKATENKQTQSVDSQIRETPSNSSSSGVETTLANLLDAKFSVSSKAQTKNVSISGGNIHITLLSDGYGSDDLMYVAIDVAIILNRHPDYSFSSVTVEGQRERFIFSNALFAMYRSGQINDMQFAKKAERQRK